VTRRTLAIDSGLAVLLAALGLIIAPGLAIVAISALAIVLVCAISFVVGARPRRRRQIDSRARRG
jgi:hypothetical protein